MFLNRYVCVKDIQIISIGIFLDKKEYYSLEKNVNSSSIFFNGLVLRVYDLNMVQKKEYFTSINCYLNSTNEFKFMYHYEDSKNNMFFVFSYMISVDFSDIHRHIIFYYNRTTNLFYQLTILKLPKNNSLDNNLMSFYLENHNIHFLNYKCGVVHMFNYLILGEDKSTLISNDNFLIPCENTFIKSIDYKYEDKNYFIVSIAGENIFYTIDIFKKIVKKKSIFQGEKVTQKFFYENQFIYQINGKFYSKDFFGTVVKRKYFFKPEINMYGFGHVRSGTSLSLILNKNKLWLDIYLLCMVRDIRENYKFFKDTIKERIRLLLAIFQRKRINEYLYMIILNYF
jgi:hypothetical protein